MVNNNEDTSSFYLDGIKFNPEIGELGFMAREKPNYEDFEPKIRSREYDLVIAKNERPVEILRPLLFFHAGQGNVTLGKLREFYMDKSIALFEEFEYIKIKQQ